MYTFKYYIVYFGGFASRWETKEFKSLSSLKKYIKREFSEPITWRIYVEEKGKFELIEEKEGSNSIRIYNEKLYNEVNN